MKNEVEAWRARYKLDEYLRRLYRLTRRQPPRLWIRDIRDALGISAAELARRMGIRQPSLTELEQSEQRGHINLASLQKAAAAMNCKLVYAFVPASGTLEGVLSRRRARARFEALLQKEIERQEAEKLKPAPPPRPLTFDDIMANSWETLRRDGKIID